jgi:hypothetical protein
MTSFATQYVLWVTRDDAAAVGDALLRERAGVEDSAVEVHTKALRKSDVATVPAGSRDERGTVFPEIINVGYNQLPPEGRVYVARQA